MEAQKKRLGEEDVPLPGEAISGQTGTIAQLIEEPPPKRRRKRAKKRPIGFQIGDLGHLDRDVE